MKKTSILISALVLTAALITGCGCRNSKPAATTMPTTMPTVATTEPTTRATTAPTTAETILPGTEPTLQDGNGPLSTDSTETGPAADSRNRTGGMGTGNGITGSITG